MKNSHAKRWVFAGLCIGCAIWLAIYLHGLKARTASSAGVTDHQVRKLSAAQPRQIFFRYMGIDDNYAHYGKLAVVDYGNLGQPRFVDGISCQSVHFASGHGICLTANWSAFPPYSARIFDAGFKQLFSFNLAGTPSRTRVAPDGSLGAFTVFVTGHEYTSVGFSTQTQIVDMVRGQIIASLEDFKVTRDGQRFAAPDFNFWGVTFTPDSRRFYCTLSSNLKHYLVEGNIAARTATVIHENVECPSVSPDGTRVAYKKRLEAPGRVVWQLQILDLATKVETPLAEKRSVDDQLEWLDDTQVLYAVSDNPNPEGSSATTSVWKADADGKAPPALFLPKAFSPAVVR